MTKPEWRNIRHSGFVIDSDFWFRNSGLPYTTCTRRPALRLRLIICRPFLVRILERKPMLRARFILLVLWG